MHAICSLLYYHILPNTSAAKSSTTWHNDKGPVRDMNQGTLLSSDKELTAGAGPQGADFDEGTSPRLRNSSSLETELAKLTFGEASVTPGEQGDAVHTHAPQQGDSQRDTGSWRRKSRSPSEDESKLPSQDAKMLSRTNETSQQSRSKAFTYNSSPSVQVDRSDACTSQTRPQQNDKGSFRTLRSCRDVRHIIGAIREDLHMVRSSLKPSRSRILHSKEPFFTGSHESHTSERCFASVVIDKANHVFFGLHLYRPRNPSVVQFLYEAEIPQCLTHLRSLGDCDTHADHTKGNQHGREPQAAACSSTTYVAAAGGNPVEELQTSATDISVGQLALV